MPYNGSGTFNRIYSWVTDAANGIFVSSSRTDTDTDDIASGLSNCVTRDGQSLPTANLPMGSFKLTGLGAGSANGESVRYEQLAQNSPNGLCEGRLTLTSGVPVTTTDVTAAETLYFTPYRGNRITLRTAGTWASMTFTELSIDIPDATNAYDVYAYNNGGVAALELLAWTNPTTRATLLATQDGILVKTGDTTRRYLGTFYCTTAGNGQTEDSVANRFLFNYYNQVPRPMLRQPGNVSWAGTGSWAQANGGDTANQLNVCIGVQEVPVTAEITVGAAGTVVGQSARIALGLDSTTTISASQITSRPSAYTAGSQNMVLYASGNIYTGVGLHAITWLEVSSANITWNAGGTDTGQNIRSGMSGIMMG